MVANCNGEKRVSNDKCSIYLEFAAGDWRDPGTTIDLPRKIPNAYCNSHAHLFVPNSDVPLNYSTQLRPSSTPPRLPARPAEINFSKHDLMGNIKMPSCITKALG